jgi:hypothetical protein
LEVAIAVGGYRKGGRVGLYIAQWTIAQRQLGHEPSVEEAAAWWKEPERTWYHRQAEFRQVFPGLGTPAPIAAQVIADYDGRLGKGDATPVIAYLGRVPAAAAA